MTASGRALRLLLSLAVIIVLMAAPAGIPVPTTLPAASAEPAPGEPGGNHSLPGDNKKKKRDDDQRRRNTGSDWQQRGSDQSDSQRQQQGSNTRPTSRVGVQPNEGSQQMPRQATGREPHPYYPDRSTDGTYRSGNSGFDGLAEEQRSWDAREAQTGIPIERKKIRVRITDPTNPNGPPVQREYDGLEEISPGKYRGLEHKVGSSLPTPNQRLADGLVRSGIPGRGVLNGKPIEVVDVADVRVPTPPPPGVAPPAPAAAPAPPAPAAPPVPAVPPAVAPPAPAAPPVPAAPPAVAPPVAPPPAPVVVAPPDTSIAWGAMFHDYARSFYGPLVTVGAGLAAVGGLLSNPLAGHGLAGGG